MTDEQTRIDRLRAVRDDLELLADSDLDESWVYEEYLREIDAADATDDTTAQRGDADA